MIEDKKTRHRNKPNRMNDAEIMVILILFHSGGFRCFKHYYKEYVCKHLKHLFPRQVSYNRFVELEKEVLLPMTIFIKKVLLGTCTGISFVDSTPLRVCRNHCIQLIVKGKLAHNLSISCFIEVFPRYFVFIWFKR